VAKELKVSIVRGGVFERVDYDVFGNELKNELRIVVNLQGPFDGREDRVRIEMRFGNDELIQLTTAIGYYSLLAMTVNVCELEPAEGAETLKV